MTNSIPPGRLSFPRLKIFIVLLLIVYVVLAQDPPSNPQPGPSAVPQPTQDSSGDKKSSGNNSKNGEYPSATKTGGASVHTTVAVIDGTTTTIIVTATPTAPVLQPAGLTGAPAIPKSVQSVLVIASTIYGKMLPAAAPPDDHIESHFWDQFKPPPGGGGGGKSAAISDCRIASFFITQSLAMVFVAAVLAIDML